MRWGCSGDGWESSAVACPLGMGAGVQGRLAERPGVEGWARFLERVPRQVALLLL